MSDYGVTSKGFKRKRLDLILEELNSEMKSIFGSNFNVSPESPDGQINGIVSESNANLWELAEEAHNAFNPSAVTGVTLSNLVQLNGITRLRATRTRVQLLLTGTNGTTVPAGSLVSAPDTGGELETLSTVTIGQTGQALVFAQALEFGPITLLANSVTEIDTPITGWNTVNNPEDAESGSDEETDAQLRARRERSVARDAQAIIDAIFAAVANVDGVTQTVVLENDTDVENSAGLPAHSFQVIVSGGADQDIADAIWFKKPAGIQAFGDVISQVEDSQGISHDIAFTRPIPIDIYVEVTLARYPEYPSNGDELIRQAFVDYGNGDLVPGVGFNLSDDVIFTRLYTPLNSVQGHEVISLKIGFGPSPTGTSSLAIGPSEIARFTIENITVL